ncbi:MAG: glycosyltransferase [Actinobacteria bacterium]|nr:MAG: glycosyltransferase [Actinomycetota bacterium]
MPLVSVLLAVHDDARFVRTAVESVLRQTLRDLELVVIDDASTDDTPDALAAVRDSRVHVERNDRQLGLAASLNRGLDRASGRYLARLDADDVAMPERLALQVARMQREPRVAVVGSAVLDLDEGGRPGRLHRMPAGALAVRWQALFSSPFFHPTVLVDREVLERHWLRYDPALLESEDYDLWARLLEHADGDNLTEPLVLKRIHPGQATLRRGDLQRSFQRDVALREIGKLTPDAEGAWRFGVGEKVRPDAFLGLLRRFEERHGVDRGVRDAAARRLARAGHVATAIRLSPTVFGRAAARRIRRPDAQKATSWLRELSGDQALRVAVVSPEPTPYRAPLFDRVSTRPDVELTVVYAARTVAGRTWSVEPHHPSVFLDGVRVPGVARLLHHEYPVTPGITRALAAADPQVVVVSGWSTFASQAAVAWCRRRRIPYVLLVESHDHGPRPGWRRAVKGTVVPRLVRPAAGALAVGSLARRSLEARGADAERIRVFANTIDVPAWRHRAAALAKRRPELRAGLGFGEEDVVVVSVGRVAAEKGFDTLIRSVADAGDERLALVLAGHGPEQTRLEWLASELGVRLHTTGHLDSGELARVYVAGDVFALLSSRESWGVVVNEAAASGLPLVLSDQVGAAHDLLRDGENGFLVPAGDAAAAARALRRLAADPVRRSAMGERSQALVGDWDYDSSVESFVAAVHEAIAR